VECVYAVIEVKKFIDRKELDIIFRNMLSARSLEKKHLLLDIRIRQPNGNFMITIGIFGLLIILSSRKIL
jgi:hypothetical protein